MCISTDSFPRSSQILAAFISVWLILQQVHSQSRESAFGLIREVPTGGTFERLRVLEGKKDKFTLLLWTERSTKFTIATLDSSCQTLTTREHFLPIPFDDILTADLLGRDKPDLVVVHRALRRISIITDLLPDSLNVTTSLNVPFNPTNIVLGDINNDKRTDILIFNREQPGILPFIGMGRGNFRQAPSIVPDNPVGGLALVQLNNDFLTDIVFYDWVKSDLHLLYGVGQGKFIDQTSFPVDGEARELKADESMKGKGPNFLLGFKTPPQLQLWSGDGLGYFRPTSSSKLKSSPSDLLVNDLNNDGWKDVVLRQGSNALQVYLGLGDELSLESIEFQTAPETRDVLLSDVNGDGKIDAVLLGRNGADLFLYFNADQTNVLVDSLEFVTGLRPIGAAITDVNGDGLNDVVLVNAKSNTLSIFPGRGQSGIGGQHTFSLPSRPRSVDFHSVVDSTARFLISYPTESTVSVWSLNLRDNSTLNAIIPTAGESEVLSWQTSVKEQISFFAYNSVTPAATPSLAFFQQLGPKTFIERSFRLSIPDALLGAAVGDLNNDGYVDVAYVYRNVGRGRYELAVSLGDSSMSFRRKSFAYTVTDSLLKKSYLWMSDFDHDGNLDLLFLFPLTSRKLNLARGLGDGTLAPPVAVPEEVSVTDRAQIRVLDLDGDGHPDIVINNSASGELGWLKGRGDCNFETWRTLVSAPKIGHFAWGDLNGDGILDLALSLTDKGTMKVYNGQLFFPATSQKHEH